MKRMRLALVLAFLALSAFPAVAEDWFDAYERGLQALKQGDGAKAADWLERAVRKRPDPGTNVYTYGTNRLARYHPYLALAEAYLLAGRPAEAREALQRSEARGKEPAAERERLAARVKAELEKTRVAAATPPPTQVATTPPTAAPSLAPTQAPVATTAPTAPPAAPAAATSAAATSAPATGPRRATTGILAIDSEPTGATVFLGSRLVGMTPLEIELAAGAYDVTLRREGAAEQRFPVEVRAGQRNSERRVLATIARPAPPAAVPATGTIAFTSEPPGVSVYVDDVPLGTTDPVTGRLTKSGLAPGTHHVRLSRPGYSYIAEDVAVAANEVTRLHRTLAPESTTPAVWAAIVVALAAAVAAASWLAFRRRGRASRDPRTTVDPTFSNPATVARETMVPMATMSQLSPTRTTSLSVGTQSHATPPPAHAARAHTSGDTTHFGEFQLLDPLGKGGMAWVYRAERRGDTCALKRPLNALLEDPEFLERFMREAEIGRTLHHPNIIRIFERGAVDGVPYFTMELVQGETLQALLRRTGALDARAATHIVAQVAEALDYAHLKGVVHRDLKPSNIMISRDGVVKVMDYGIARARRFEGLTVTGAFLGTPDYIAPEAAEGGPIDARSDLYALGVVFFETLTGRRPFVADTPFAIVKKHCSEPPPSPRSVNAAVPAELDAIVLKLLSKKPEDRYAGAEELLIALRDFLNRAA